jgi:hypothetical protein
MGKSHSYGRFFAMEVLLRSSSGGGWNGCMAKKSCLVAHGKRSNRYKLEINDMFGETNSSSLRKIKLIEPLDEFSVRLPLHGRASLHQV